MQLAKGPFWPPLIVPRAHFAGSCARHEASDTYDWNPPSLATSNPRLPASAHFYRWFKAATSWPQNIGLYGSFNGRYAAKGNEIKGT
jgi:hypothetical protein